MGSFLEYKDYIGSVEFSAEDNVLYGKVLGINDLVNFEATSVDELREAFKDAVNDYLTTCEELDKEPNKFFKGVFNVRTGSDRHRELALIAGKRNIKLNEVVNVSFEYLIKHEEEVFGKAQ
ncbi:type II toxin-antitoxin system HicB family antitoxin [Flagellimonas algicola]|uniref:Type II toxin-antitoxin system HicB family antitoxin n=1 Tax=Flagellimonas algicola TaxID=2583815 RepID=A0ABY2WK67_9FLAO|nr:type II toxin-antitoxin system HicB family antitoxin [Allomuricauda algicola]TMU54995.1 type II toxin-antitoxin system HicB family antitoxin [Allomuricauda algicola]